MRAMKARQMGRAPRSSPDRRQALPSELDEETEEPMEGELFVDQGDGVVVSTGGRRRGVQSEGSSYDCPDEPPAGWAETDD